MIRTLSGRATIRQMSSNSTLFRSITSQLSYHEINYFFIWPVPWFCFVPTTPGASVPQCMWSSCSTLSSLQWSISILCPSSSISFRGPFSDHVSPDTFVSNKAPLETSTFARVSHHTSDSFLNHSALILCLSRGVLCPTVSVGGVPCVHFGAVAIIIPRSAETAWSEDPGSPLLPLAPSSFSRKHCCFSYIVSW